MSERAVIVGKRVKAMRMQKGISQSELAHSVGISQAHMSNIENGHSNITLENLFSLHDILGVSMASFFVDIDGIQEAKEVKYAKGFIGLDDMIDALLLIKNNKLSSQVLSEPAKEEQFNKQLFVACGEGRAIYFKLPAYTDNLTFIFKIFERRLRCYGKEILKKRVGAWRIDGVCDHWKCDGGGNYY